MEAYVEQLTSLKTHITQLQEDFGEFENLNELHEKVSLHASARLIISMEHSLYLLLTAACGNALVSSKSVEWLGRD